MENNRLKLQGQRFQGSHFGHFAVSIAHGFFSPSRVDYSMKSDELIVTQVDYSQSPDAFDHAPWYNHIYAAKKFFRGGFEFALMTQDALSEDTFRDVEAYLRSIAAPIRSVPAAEYFEGRFAPLKAPPFDCLLWATDNKYHVSDVGYAGLSGCSVLTRPDMQWCGNYTSRLRAPRTSLERLKKIASVLERCDGSLYVDGRLKNLAEVARGIVSTAGGTDDRKQSIGLFQREPLVSRALRIPATPSQKPDEQLALADLAVMIREGFNRVDDRFAQVDQDMKHGFEQVYKEMNNGFQQVYKDMNNGFQQVYKEFKQVDIKIDSLSADLQHHARRIGEVNSAHAICEEVSGNVGNFVHVERGGPSVSVTVKMNDMLGSDIWSTLPRNVHSVQVGHDSKGIAVHAFDRILDLN